MAALIESIFFGDEAYPEQPEAIVVWLSDSPQLNEQSKDKIDLKADKIRLGQCVTVQDDSFDQEMFDDGHIYFLNTQKLGKGSNLTKHTDNRQYTIWETLANTAREKSDRLYFIIDEAHHAVSDSYQRVIQHFPDSHILGVTAHESASERHVFSFVVSPIMSIGERKREREQYVAQIAEEVSRKMEESGIEAKVDGRVKHFFSIYKKMVNQGKTLDQIYDLFAVRIIVNTVKDCYAALGIIHEMYTPMPGRFKDYIAMPKPNNYRSLHTTLIGSSGQPFEIQIRTYEMHREAEYGIAAHWKYKEVSNGQKVDNQEEEKLTWLRQILEWQQDMPDNKTFMDGLKSNLDLFSDDVYCFTPNGEVKTLRAGSTPIDFAYAIHTAVGNKMIGARVNGKLVTLDYQIQNGDRVEIMTSQNSKGPSRDWLALAKSPQTRNKINQWFKQELKDENIERGRDLIAAYCKTKGLNQAELEQDAYKSEVLRKYGFRDWEAVLAAIGHGGVKEGQIVNKLKELYDADHRKDVTDEDILRQVEENAQKIHARGSNPIVVKGVHDVAVHLSKCCNPVPGDEIVGFVTRGRGVTIHRTDCVNILHMPEIDRPRLIEAEWEEGVDTTSLSGDFEAEIVIHADDRNGLLSDVSHVFTDNGINITSINTNTSKQHIATLSVTFHISGKSQLETIIGKIGQIRSVRDVQRA